MALVPVIQLRSTTHPTNKYKPTLFTHKLDTTHSTATTALQCIVQSEILVNNIRTRFVCVEFSTKHDCIALCDHRGTLYTLNLKHNYYTMIRTGVQCNVLKWLNGTMLLAGGSDGIVRIYDTDTLALLLTLKGHTHAIHCIYIHDKYIITSSTDCTILWQLYDEYGVISDRCKKLKTINTYVKQCIFSHNYTELYTLIDNTIYVWSLVTYTELYSMSIPFEQQTGSTTFVINCICLTNNNEYIIAGCNSNTLYIFNLASQQLIHTLTLPLTVFSVNKMLPVANTALYVTALTSDGSIYLCNTEYTEYYCIVQSVNDNNNIDYSISHTLQYIAAITRKGSMRLYNVGNTLKQLSKPYNTRQPILPPQPITPAKVNTVQPMSTTPLLSPTRTPHNLLDISKLRRMLDRYGEFPAKHRLLIYRYLLQLPENTTAYHTITVQGIHPCYKDLYDKYPIKSQRLYRRLQVLCSNLAYYNELFGIVDYMPVFVFPFIKSLTSFNDEILFELIVTFILNICNKWYELHPNVPVVLLNACDRMLQIQDPELHTYLHTTLQCNSNDIFWTGIQSLYQNNLTTENWLVMLDYILCDEPVFYYYLAVAFIIYNKSAILHCNNKTDFVHSIQQNLNLSINVKKWILDAQTLRNNTTFDIHTQFISNTIGATERKPYTAEWSFLPAGQYVTIDLAPKFIVDYQLKQRQIIANEIQGNLDKQKQMEQLQEQAQHYNMVHSFNTHNNTLYEHSNVQNTLKQNKLNEILRNTTNLVDYSLQKQQIQNINAENRLLQQQLHEIQGRNNIHKNNTDEYKYNENINKRTKEQRQQVHKQSQRIQAVQQHNNKQLADQINHSQVQQLVQQQKQYIERNNELNDELLTQLQQQRDALHAAKLAELEQQQAELQQFHAQLKLKQQLDNTYNIERLKSASKQQQSAQQHELDNVRVDAILTAEHAKLELLKQQNLAAQHLQQQTDTVLAEQQRYNDTVLQQQQQYMTEQVLLNELNTMKQAQQIASNEQKQATNAFLTELNNSTAQQLQQQLNNEAYVNDILNAMQKQQLQDQTVVTQSQMATDLSDIKLAYQTELQQQHAQIIHSERVRFAALRNELYQYMNDKERKLIDKHEQNMLKLLERRSLQLARLREIWRSNVQTNELQRLEAEYMLSVEQIEQYNQQVQNIESDVRDRLDVNDGDISDSSIDTVSTE